MAQRGKLHARVSWLSNAERQRVAIRLRWPASRDAILDEPSPGLDPQSRRQILELVQVSVAAEELSC